MAKDRIEEARKASSNPPQESQAPPALVNLASVAAAAASQQPAATPPAEAVKSPADQRDELIFRLQAQLAAERARVDDLQRLRHAGPDEAKSLARNLPTRPFRVRLDGAKVKLSQVAVGPRQAPGPLVVDPAPTLTYDTLALALEYPDLSPQDAAWTKYAAKNGLDVVRNRSQYKCRMQPGETVESIVVPAVSAADAEHVYRRFNGVLSTSMAFHVEPVAEQEQQGA